MIAQDGGGITRLCPTGLQPRPAEYPPNGIILTTFDGANLWVYDIARGTRYPLPETRPCTSNCRLSPDAQWLLYPDPSTLTFNKMRLDGTQRTPLVSNAADVLWWSNDTLLVWTPDQRAYLRPETDANQVEFLPTRGVISIQPRGRYGVLEEFADGAFRRVLVDLTQRANPDALRVRLNTDTAYFNSMAWSPDGSALAYVGRGAIDPTIQIASAEVYLLRVGSALPQQLTFLSLAYGAARIDGYALESLSWSPNGTKLAFWVSELLGADAETQVGQAVIHVLDVASGALTAYCGYATDEHTPTTPRLIWSPDSTKIAFGGNVPEDSKGYLLLALDVATGIITELSDGIYPALGRPDVIAWGYR